MRRLLFIDSSYTLADIRARALEHVLEIRHLDGYWGRVISAHPLDIPSTGRGGDAGIGPALVENINAEHKFVRGRFGRYAALERLTVINAVMSLLDFCFTLLRLAKKERIDAVRSGDPLLCGLIGLVVARSLGAKFVVRIPANHRMIRASTGEPMQSRFTRSIRVEEWLERFVISRADLIIAPSSNYAEYAISNGALREQIHLVRYGAMIDPRHQLSPQDRPEPQIRGLEDHLTKRPWMLHVGRLDKIKHIEDCFGVLETLAANGSDAGLILVGDGPMRSLLETRSKQAGLCDRTLFLGNIAQDQLFALLPAVSVVLSPLTGRALAEAAFAACPIVAYDLDWQGELIRDGETGVLVPPRDAAAMAAGAARLIDDPELGTAMGDAVRALAIDILSPEATYAAECAAYDALGIEL